jgi:hypothetical protein
VPSVIQWSREGRILDLPCNYRFAEESSSREYKIMSGGSISLKRVSHAKSLSFPTSHTPKGNLQYIHRINKSARVMHLTSYFFPNVKGRMRFAEEPLNRYCD